MQRLDGRAFRVLGFLTALLAAVVGASAQDASIGLNVDSSNIGLGGKVQPCVWAPILVEVNCQHDKPVTVKLQVVLEDVDGDTVQFQRIVTLTPHQDNQPFWVYAMPPAEIPLAKPWRIQVLSNETDEVLNTLPVTLETQVLPGNVSVIGVIGSAEMGLSPYTENVTTTDANSVNRSDFTQQERIHVIRGVSPTKLPDRWYGLSMFQWLIWTPEAVAKDPTVLSPGAAQAIRDWVRRGGHLVIILPAHGELWSSSPLADLLPPGAMHEVNDVTPPIRDVGSVEGSGRTGKMTIRTFDPSGDLTTIFDYQGQPWVVARQVGFGRVTTVGLDITDPLLRQAGQPHGPWLWNGIFNWRSPADRPEMRRTMLEGNAPTLARPWYRDIHDLGDFIGPEVAMRETAVGAVLAAIVLFGLYWLVAGPVGHFVLKSRGMVRHTWVGFVAAAGVFSVIAWGGAMLLRPGTTMAKHVTVVDAIAGSDQVHVQSWLSLFVPTHGRVALDLAGDPQAQSFDILATPGLPHSGDPFPDPQHYAVDSASPHKMAVPFRATTKDLTIDYLGQLPGGAEGAWGMPQAAISAGPDGPKGDIVHHLPGTLKNVEFVYCDDQRDEFGKIAEPWCWNYSSWKPGDRIIFNGRPTGAKRMLYGGAQDWTGGELQSLIASPPGGNPFQTIEMLSFFSTLPPPNYRPDPNSISAPHAYSRSMGRGLDLSGLVHMRRLIVIGFLEDAALPAPLTVDGSPAPRTKGLTCVRWIYPIP